jgi:hypothetical protein
MNALLFWVLLLANSVVAVLALSSDQFCGYVNLAAIAYLIPRYYRWRQNELRVRRGVKTSPPFPGG